MINSALSDTVSVDERKRWVVLCTLPEGETRDTAIVVELEARRIELIDFPRLGEPTLELHRS